MSKHPVHIRPAVADDAPVIAELARAFTQSFTFSRSAFDTNIVALLDDEHAHLLVAVDDQEGCLGYLLGFWHLTFYANGPVGWVEEITVNPEHRGQGIGRALMLAFERWAAVRHCGLVAMATRRATPFYLALGYTESASYLRKLLPVRVAGRT